MNSDSFRLTTTKIYAKRDHKSDSDHILGRNYSGAVLLKEFGPIDYIDFAPVEPYNFAVTCSCRVQIYDSNTRTVQKNFNKFSKSVYGASYRYDGRLLCVGGEEAVIKVFDVDSKSLLRQFSDHKAAVHRAYFTSDGTHLVSFSDDKTTALWDIPAEKKVVSFSDHIDYVRAGSVSPISPSIFSSGGYDGTINMYDSRTSKNILRLSHESPVQSLCFLPHGGVLISAGGPEIRVWDFLNGGRLLAKISHHHKAVTCLRIASNGRRIVSGSLDKTVRVFDSGTFKLLRSLDYPNPILSLSVSMDDQTVVVGMSDGMISIRRDEPDCGKNTSRSSRLESKSPTRYPQFEDRDLNVSETLKEVMSKHDALLRKFEYSKALDQALMNQVVMKSPYITVAVFQELIRRNGLVQALAGRDRKSLGNVLKFIIRHVGSIIFGSTLIVVSNSILDTHIDFLSEMSAESGTQFVVFRKKLIVENNLISSLLGLHGMIGMMKSLHDSTPDQLTIRCNFDTLPMTR